MSFTAKYTWLIQSCKDSGRNELCAFNTANCDSIGNAVMPLSTNPMIKRIIWFFMRFLTWVSVVKGILLLLSLAALSSRKLSCPAQAGIHYCHADPLMSCWQRKHFITLLIMIYYYTKGFVQERGEQLLQMAVNHSFILHFQLKVPF